MSMQKPSRHEPMYSINDILELLGIHQTTFHRWLRNGKFPPADTDRRAVNRESFASKGYDVANAIKIKGNRHYWRRSVVEKWIAEYSAINGTDANDV